MPYEDKQGYFDTIDEIYKTTYTRNSILEILPITAFTTLKNQGSPPKVVDYEDKTIEIVTPDNNIIAINGENGGSINLTSSGTYSLRYKGENAFYVPNIVTGGQARYYSDYSFYYVIAVVENKNPLKKSSITDVINRTLDLAEPLRKGEKSRFKLQGMKWDGTILPNTQADKFNKILSPQFSFTKQTLRECLQEVGKVVHGEPRLSIQKDENGYFYEVSYDMYASQEESNLQFFPYTSKSAQHVIENYKEIHQSYSYFCSCLRNNFIPLLRVFTIELSRIKVEYCNFAQQKSVPLKGTLFNNLVISE